MVEPLTCPNGHPWHPAGEEPPPGSGPAPVCPVCGAACAEEAPPHLLAAPPDTEGEMPPPPRWVPTVVAQVAAGMRALPEQAAAADQPTVAGYDILTKLGRGGMGVVYLARQVRLQRLVALKMILAGAQATAEELARFRNEAESVARLQHPNIVQIYEIGDWRAGSGSPLLPYFSLEFIEGGSLAQKLAGAPQPARVGPAGGDAAPAVHFAHERGVVHRDLKPANILLQNDERGTMNEDRPKEGKPAA